LESNQDSKGAHHILHEDTDKYYYSPCSSKKWVVLQLSEDIKVWAEIAAEFFVYDFTLIADVAGATCHSSERRALFKWTATISGERQHPRGP